MIWVAAAVAYLIVGALVVYVCARFLGLPEGDAPVVMFSWPVIIGLVLPVGGILIAAGWVVRFAKRGAK